MAAFLIEFRLSFVWPQWNLHATLWPHIYWVKDVAPEAPYICSQIALNFIINVGSILSGRIPGCRAIK